MAGLHRRGTVFGHGGHSGNVAPDAVGMSPGSETQFPSRACGRRLDPDRLPDHVDRLYRAAWALSGSPHDAENLVQDTYAAVPKRHACSAMATSSAICCGHLQHVCQRSPNRSAPTADASPVGRRRAESAREPDPRARDHGGDRQRTGPMQGRGHRRRRSRHAVSRGRPRSACPRSDLDNASSPRTPARSARTDARHRPSLMTVPSRLLEGSVAIGVLLSPRET